MGLEPLARLARAFSRLARRRRLRGIITFTPAPRLKRWETIVLRVLGFTPSMAGGNGEGEPGTDADADRGRTAAGGRTEPTGGASSTDTHGGAAATRDPDRFDRDYVERLRRENATYRTRAQRAEADLEAVADARRTELERATRRADRAEAELTQTRDELWRLRAAVKHGIPEDLADLLTGSTEEEVMDRAARLARSLGDGSGGRVPSPPRGPRRDETPDLDTQIAEAEKKGDWRTAGALKTRKLAQANT